MENVGDLVDLLLEDTQRVGIGEHECRDIFVHLRFQSRNVNHAASIRFQILDRVVHHRGSRRICSVRRVWNENFLPRIALRLVVSPHHQ